MRHEQLVRHFLPVAAGCLVFAGRGEGQVCDGLRWRPANDVPTGRRGSGLVFDADREVLVTFGGLYLYGGLNNPTYLESNETWVWDGATWERRASVLAPSPRDSHSMAYDPVHHSILLFGGQPYGGVWPLGDTWEFNCFSGQWIQRTPTVSPPLTTGAAMTFDPISGHMLMFGGYYTNNSVNTMWEWDSDAGTWSQRAQINPPSPRSFLPFAAEPTPGHFLLFGGWGDGQPDIDETWRFDSSTSTWTRLEPPVHPSGRADHAVVSDPVRGRVVLFGGAQYGSGLAIRLGDTWEWDPANETWTQRFPLRSPSARENAGGAFDAKAGRVTLYGGHARGSSYADVNFGDVWQWDGDEWTKTFEPPRTPVIGNSPSVAYDAARQRVVMLSYLEWTANAPSTMWEWDDRRWTPVAATGPMPGNAPLAFDGTRVICVFQAAAGTLETWGWDGAAWQRLAESPGTIAADTQLAFDSDRGRVVMFIGRAAQTWEWDGGHWTQMASIVPAPRLRYAMSYDPGRRRTLIVGGVFANGLTYFHDTWAWNGASWASIATQSTSVDFGLGYDPVREVSVLVDQQGVYELAREGGWHAVSHGGLVSRPSASLVNHAQSGHLLIVGGYADGAHPIEQTEHVPIVRGCPVCYPNCDNSAAPPTLNVNDFQCFLNRFAKGDPYANCDHSTAAPTLTAADFHCFLNQFVAGCV